MKKPSNRTILKRIKNYKKDGIITCPTCGCRKYKFIDHFATYPDVWYQSICRNCGLTVTYADNSLPWSICDEIQELGLLKLKDMRALHKKFYDNDKRR